MTGPTHAPTWRTVSVGRDRVRLMEAGRGDPLLFLHGWGLTPRSYQAGVTRLCAAGIRVLAPALPGFDGSSRLGLDELRADLLGGYARRLAALLESLEIDKPVFVVGHSFGGGVALRLAAERPDLVRSLTLVNTIGGAPGTRAGISRRSWLRWALGAMTELDPREALAIAPAVLRDFVPNAVRRPLTTAVTAVGAMRASLADVATDLVAQGLPMLFVWSDRDRIIAPGAFGRVVGTLPAESVSGRHGWLLTYPQEFADLLRNALVVHAMLERQRRGQALFLPPGVSLADVFPPERRHRARHTPASDAGRSGAG